MTISLKVNSEKSIDSSEGMDVFNAVILKEWFLHLSFMLANHHLTIFCLTLLFDITKTHYRYLCLSYMLLQCNSCDYPCLSKEKGKVMVIAYVLYTR